MQAPIDIPLRDIHLPEAVSWWPPAPGWWILAGVVFAVAAGIWFYRAYHRRRRVLYALQAQCEQLRTAAEHEPASRIIDQASVLLRRACLSFFQRNDVASLTGNDWIAFLNERTANSFDDTQAGLLTESLYRRTDDIDREQCRALVDNIARQLPVLFRRGRSA